MTTSAGRPNGLMVVHAWVEPADGMRVRITRTVDLRSARTETSYARGTADALRVVEQWLADLQSSEDPATRE